MQEPKYEMPFRFGILAGLFVVVMFAAYATYRLHKIADFKVLQTTRNKSRVNIIFLGTLQFLQNCDGVHI